MKFLTVLIERSKVSRIESLTKKNFFNSMNILDQNINEAHLNDYQSDKKKIFLILGCILATFFSSLIYNYNYYNVSFGRNLWWSIVFVFSLSIIPGIAATLASLVHRNPKKNISHSFCRSIRSQYFYDNSLFTKE